MLNYEYISLRSVDSKLLLISNLSEFKYLLPRFESELEFLRYDIKKVRMRADGGGRKPKYFFKVSRLLFLVLFYIKAYPTYDLMESIFKLDKSNNHYRFTLGFKALENNVGHHIPLPVKKYNSIKEHILDSTEQSINRPKYDQKNYYSGKKERDTIKRYY